MSWVLRQFCKLNIASLHLRYLITEFLMLEVGGIFISTDALPFVAYGLRSSSFFLLAAIQSCHHLSPP